MGNLIAETGSTPMSNLSDNKDMDAEHSQAFSNGFSKRRIQADQIENNTVKRRASVSNNRENVKTFRHLNDDKRFQRRNPFQRKLYHPDRYKEHSSTIRSNDRDGKKYEEPFNEFTKGSKEGFCIRRETSVNSEDLKPKKKKRKKKGKGNPSGGLNYSDEQGLLNIFTNNKRRPMESIDLEGDNQLLRQKLQEILNDNIKLKL